MQPNKLIFATNNPHKVDEVKHIIGSQYSILSLAEAGIVADIPEPYNTLEENAEGKSKFIHSLTHQNCFSEDTGLEVEALNGEPGVKSARYAGEGRNFSANIDKLLRNMQGKKDRGAQFKTVISLILSNEQHLFEGVCSGTITELPSGEGGFGYDAVFYPRRKQKTFAEMTMDEKNKYSHRRKATDKLIHFYRTTMAELKAIKGDITKLAVDAIVNAANSSLLGGGGVDGAIHRAGGKGILDECRAIIARQGKCKTGEAVITSAGNMPSRYVVHTVGPVWNGGKNNEAEKLANCYRNSLKLAAGAGCKSIAFPNISTGVYRYPKPEAAVIAVNTVKKYASETELNEVIFICFDEENYKLIEKLLQ